MHEIPENNGFGKWTLLLCDKDLVQLLQLMSLRYVQDLSNVRICKKYRCTKGTYGKDFSRTIVGCIFVVSLLMFEFGGLVFLNVACF